MKKMLIHHRNCVALLRHAELVKQLGILSDFSEKNKGILQKYLDTLNNKELVDFVAAWKETCRTLSVKNYEFWNQKQKKAEIAVNVGKRNLDANGKHAVFFQTSKIICNL